MTRSSLQDALKEQSITSTYYKIFLNYCQFVSLSVSINLSWPGIVHQFLVIQRKATGGAEQFIVLDCVLPDQSEPVYTKLILLSIVPLFCASATIIIWIIIRFFRKTTYIKEKIIGSIVVQIFFFQPSIVQYTFSMFNCSELDPDEMFLSDNLSIPCWKNEHLIYTLAVALPSLLVWCILIPFGLLIFLRRQRAVLGETSQMLKYGFLYKEFRNDKFYWEFFTMLRKLLMICSVVFLKDASMVVQGLVTFIIILVGFIFQDKLRPYKYDQLNKMETWSILASAVTIYAGIMLFGEVSDGWSNVLVALLITTNLLFMLYWAYYAFGFYFGKIYIKFPIFKRCFRGKLDDWAKKIAPENVTDLNKVEVNDEKRIQINQLIENSVSCKTAMQVEDGNCTRVEAFGGRVCLSLESEDI